MDMYIRINKIINKEIKHFFRFTEKTLNHGYAFRFKEKKK